MVKETGLFNPDFYRARPNPSLVGFSLTISDINVSRCPVHTKALKMLIRRSGIIESR
jgi:hypothetical protein